MKKFEINWARLPRLTILASTLIYAGFLLVYYQRYLPLKNDNTTSIITTVKIVGDDSDPIIAGHVMEKLLRELDDRNLDEENNGASRVEVNVIGGGHKSLEDSKKLLEGIFYKADVDKNSLLDIRELAKWIHAKIVDHIDKAMKDNIGLFTAIDNNPRNGEISWDEYHAHFLRSHGLSDSYITSHDKRHSALSRPLKEAIMRDRARWTEAAHTDPDKLALDEFLAFTHPESSHRALLQIVEDLFEKFDRDGDEQLTEDEFADLPSEGANVDQSFSMPVIKERREEFRHLIDKNKNGKADRSELLTYIDPRNPRHAIQEARHLIELSDVDRDGKLKLPEILSKTDLFLGSKMVDTEGSFHDEFR
ncbi:45 kDa calcium-binding protein [Phymastichus coffea]|uniref:45 kDa calcium-binding protein n=1 Tax=Phymastichus coffea TaxID=108790 RepID=UPI00273C5F0F|nr:45 kDa calcium-binding protein [Phymastichus coffea]XP_058806061.1 45 kDa calcium-binding protein [Phymastichus coffea]